jgi:hypothetical protein
MPGAAAALPLVRHALAVGELVEAAKLLELGRRLGVDAVDLEAAFRTLCDAVDRLDAAESALAPDEVAAPA